MISDDPSKPNHCQKKKIENQIVECKLTINIFQQAWGGGEITNFKGFTGYFSH